MVLRIVTTANDPHIHTPKPSCVQSFVGLSFITVYLQCKNRKFFSNSYFDILASNKIPLPSIFTDLLPYRCSCVPVWHAVSRHCSIRCNRNSSVFAIQRITAAYLPAFDVRVQGIAQSCVFEYSDWRRHCDVTRDFLGMFEKP